MVLPMYARAGRRPVLYRAEVSPWWIAEPSCTRWLWPRPRSLPSLEMSAAPIWLGGDHRSKASAVGCGVVWDGFLAFGILLEAWR